MKNLARTPKDIGHAIRQTRKARKLTQKALAERSGVWQETISKVENGLPGTKLETVFDIFAALDIEIVVQGRSKGSTESFEDIF